MHGMSCQELVKNFPKSKHSYFLDFSPLLKNVSIWESNKQKQKNPENIESKQEFSCSVFDPRGAEDFWVLFSAYWLTDLKPRWLMIVLDGISL